MSLTRENCIIELTRLKKSSWLTYRELARLTGIKSSGYLSDLLSGKIKNPGATNVKKVFKVLNEHQKL